MLMKAIQLISDTEDQYKMKYKNSNNYQLINKMIVTDRQ